MDPLKNHMLNGRRLFVGQAKLNYRDSSAQLTKKMVEQESPRYSHLTSDRMLPGSFVRPPVCDIIVVDDDSDAAIILG